MVNMLQKNMLINRFWLLLCLLIMDFTVAIGQGFTNSALPIVIITTPKGVYIQDDPRVLADMKIIWQGEGIRNLVSDQSDPTKLNYSGKISIEIRGSSSQVPNKKPYGFTTKSSDLTKDENVSLLGLPSENDWILNALNFEPSLIRDYICYNLYRQMGQYATRTVYCELVLNGKYQGLYLLQEKIKSDKNRVDIIEMDANDIALPELSGGYIVKADKTTGNDPIAFTIDYVNYIHHEPKPEDVKIEQYSYVYKYFSRLEQLTSANNSSFENGFPSLIDIPSFIDYMLINEISANADAYSLSTFFHKDRNGKLRAGPIWDQNLTFGHDLFFWGFDRSKTDNWQFDDGDNQGSDFWRYLFRNQQFKCQMAKRWHELTKPGMPLHEYHIF